MSHLTPEDKAGLAEAYQPLVLKLADQFVRFLPPGGSRDDLVAAAWVAVAQALNRFDPARSRTFGTYVRPWIRGGCLRELNRQLQAADCFRLSPTGDMTGNLAPEPTEAGGPLVAVILPLESVTTEMLEQLRAAPWAAGVAIVDGELAAEVLAAAQRLARRMAGELPPE